MMLAQTLPDPNALATLGGWAFAALVLAVLLWAFVDGRIVPGSVAKAQNEELKVLRELVKEDVVPPVKKIGDSVETLLVHVRFLSDFVKDIARREGSRDDRDHT